MKIVLVTGLSGAGKSQAKRVLEDLGYYCVDNLPPSMMPGFVDFMNKNDEEYSDVALVVDIRGGKFFKDLEKNISLLEKQGHTPIIMFFEASTDVLVRRYQEIRRTHPIDPSLRLEEAIAKERKIMASLRNRADFIISTDQMSTNTMRSRIASFLQISNTDSFVVKLISFGFKYGAPMDADFVFDLRYLQNPYYIPELKSKTGNDIEVQEYVLNQPEAVRSLNSIKNLMATVLPAIQREGRPQVIIALGCTGGRHRSVTFVNKIAPMLAEIGFNVDIINRELAEG